MEADGTCFDRLQVIRDPVPHTGAVNMAIDEVLLGSTAGTALLRLYEWAEPTVSFGYFESSVSARRLAGDRQMVRRWTGGGIVEHGEDLTYSLCIPRSSALAALGGAESYRRIHSSVARALHFSGSTAESHSVAVTPAVDPARKNACFDRPVLHDLLAGGRKIAGGAQRRNRTGLLHQGSIRGAYADPVVLAAWKSSMHTALPAALALRCEERTLAENELARAHELAAAKYVTATWTDRF